MKGVDISSGQYVVWIYPVVDMVWIYLVVDKELCRLTIWPVLVISRDGPPQTPPYARYGTLLVTYDVERLYPSISHDSCMIEVERHLRERGCQLSGFAVAILGLILQLNYCTFDNAIFLMTSLRGTIFG